MPKPNHITTKLGTSKYKYFLCDECHSEGKETYATHSSGKRSPDGIGYDMKCLCDKHQKEFEESVGITMNIKEVAEILNNNQYREELEGINEIELEKAGIVVVFGASDDLMEFRGAIHDEAGCWDGGTVKLEYFDKSATKSIEALWCKEDEYSFTYKTDIPHESFEILEDDLKYCRGIVFYKKDIY